MKPTKLSVALVIKNPAGQFLVVKRADDPDDKLANVWGFPAASLKDDETEAQTAQRVGRQKLGVDVGIGQKIGSTSSERSTYILELSDYEATISSGTPSVPQVDDSVSQYADWKFTDDPSVLFEAASKGSLCSQVFLRSIDVAWS